MYKRKIVVVDDETDILELLNYCLSREGYETLVFSNPLKALEYLRLETPSLILSDWIMPEMDGLEFCRHVKFQQKLSSVPFVMITCRDDEVDIVSALELGAEDYLIKPFRLRELVARVKKIIRRNEMLVRLTETVPVEFPQKIAEDQVEGTQLTMLSRGVLRIHPDTYQVLLEGAMLQLTYTEFRLLFMLAKRPGKVFSRYQIIEQMNGDEYLATERSVDVQIVGLRRKLGKYRKMIETVRSVGYRFSSNY